MLGEEGRKGRLEKGGGSPAHVKAEIKKKNTNPAILPVPPVSLPHPSSPGC